MKSRLPLAALAALVGSQRPLFVFAAGADDPRARDQLDRLAVATGGLAEREIPVFLVAGERIEGRFGAAPPAVAAAALRNRLAVPADGFRVVLVGKDGGVKLAADAPVAPEELFALVDTMPMRRREVAERARPGGGGTR